MSHLPAPVQAKAFELAHLLDESLQSENHKVQRALEVDIAFDEGFVESTLVRALMARVVDGAASVKVDVANLGNGGREIRIMHRGIEYRIRLKRCGMDADGRLSVTANSDSMITQLARSRARAASLFDEIGDEPPHPGYEQWLLLYRLNPLTRTLIEVWLATPVGVENAKPPYRLTLSNLTRIHLGRPTPQRFIGSEDDLFGNEEKGRRGDTAN